MDVVKAHVQVYSNSEQVVVQKLSYQERVPFQITAALGNDYYEVKRYNQPDSESHKYKGMKLYLLIISIFPRDPIYTTYQQYLNCDCAPVTSPLKKTINTEVYNDTFFSAKGQ